MLAVKEHEIQGIRRLGSEQGLRPHHESQGVGQPQVRLGRFRQRRSDEEYSGGVGVEG